MGRSGENRDLRAARHLAHQLGRTRVVFHEQRQRCKTFVADHAHFEALSVTLRSENGNHAGVYKISARDGLSRIVNDLARIQMDELPFAAYPIALRVVVLLSIGDCTL